MARRPRPKPKPLVIARSGYLFAGGKIDPSIEGSPDGRADVCRVLDPEDAAASLSGRHDPRRQPDRHQLHRHAGRPRRLGAIFPAPRLCGLCGRSGGARPRRALVAGARAGDAAAAVLRRAALRRAGARQAVAAGASAHPMARHRQAGRPVLRSVLCLAISLAGRFAKQQALNRDAGIALLDKIGPAILLTHSQSGAFGWPIADARPNWSRRSSRSSRTARRCTRPSSRAPDWFADMPSARPSGLGEVPLPYDPPLPPPASSSPSCGRTRRTRPIWCAAGCRRSRRAS